MTKRLTRHEREIRATNAPKATARLKWLAPDRVRATCGREPGCPGFLAEFWCQDRDAHPDEWMTTASGWRAAAHPNPRKEHHYYRGYADTGYEVIVERWHPREYVPGAPPGRRARNGRRVGVRLLVWHEDDGALAGEPMVNPRHPKGLVGQTVVLPARVFCPVCGTLNDVSIPGSPPADLEFD